VRSLSITVRQVEPSALGLTHASSVIPLVRSSALLSATETRSLTPSNDSVLQRQPAAVTLQFNEPVESAFGSIRVYDSSAQRKDSGEISRPDDKTVVTGIDGPLEPGTYTVTWRVISADSHPVHGAFVFHYKKPGVKPGGIAASLNLEPPQSVQVGLDVARFLDFSLLLLLAGGSGALLWALASAPGQVRKRLGSVLVASAVGLAVVALAGIVFEGGVAGGFSLGDSLRWSVFHGVLETRFGKVWLAQAIMAAVFAVLTLIVRQRGDRWAAYLTAGLAIAMLATPGLAGHAHLGRKRGDHGYFSRASLTQALSAVTAACVCVRRQLFEEIGGFDETLEVAFNDVDLCLRIQAAGYRNIYTPYAELYHHESASRGYEDTPEKMQRFQREADVLRARWMPVLMNDPYYNPNLTLSGDPFGIAWPPRVERFRPSVSLPLPGSS